MSPEKKNSLANYKGNQKFARMLCRFMDEQNINAPELSEITGVSADSIREMRSPKFPAKYFSLKSVLAIAIGLHLPTNKSLKFIEAAGHHLRLDEDAVDDVYFDLISKYQNYSVAACNAYLIDLGLPPLTDNAKIFTYTEVIALE